mmetsp:Transcript_43103/g.80777  ORF Transcript_43103/g.80777 Transcript_43103/m.80777 type:complete len:202 (+) Transcript_43103:943-1548(+)
MGTCGKPCCISHCLTSSPHAEPYCPGITSSIITRSNGQEGTSNSFNASSPQVAVSTVCLRRFMHVERSLRLSTWSSTNRRCKVPPTFAFLRYFSGRGTFGVSGSGTSTKLCASRGASGCGNEKPAELSAISPGVPLMVRLRAWGGGSDSSWEANVSGGRNATVARRASGSMEACSALLCLEVEASFRGAISSGGGSTLAWP